ncbi:MAG TPA: transketolase, partial [Eubacterium sp.]|nr:transketolase [Eubacterium sp.]
TRQNLPQLQGSSKEAVRGGYIVSECKKGTPDAIIIASGSEVALSIAAQEELLKEGIDVRVVSMPSMELFDMQDEAYKEKVLPKNIRARVAVEALSTFGWDRYVGLDGEIIGMTTFGASGPQSQLFEHFGFTVKNVCDSVKRTIR